MESKSFLQTVVENIMKALMKKNFMLYVFALYAFTYAMRLVEKLLYMPLPEVNQRLADVVLGSILTVVIVTIINFMFGSSKSSSDKNDQIDELIVQIKRKNGSDIASSTNNFEQQNTTVEQVH